MMDKRKKYLLGMGSLLVFLITIGVSYAYWMSTLSQTDKNIVTSDCFKIEFTDENDINLQNASPMYNKELYSFYQNATPYHFTITNTCESHATGVINLEILNTTKKLSDSYIDVILYNGTKNYLDIARSKTEAADVYSFKQFEGKYLGINIYDYSLINNPINPEKVLTDSLTAYKLHEFTLGPLKSKEFNLLEYVSAETPPTDEVINSTFESKITVTASYRTISNKKNVLLARGGCSFESDCQNTDTTRVFQDEYINNATSISFETTMDAPATYVASFDESEARDGSIMAYVVANESDASKYTIRFQTDGTYLMPSDSSFYFALFQNVTSIEGLENIDTRNVVNMSGMFVAMISLTSLDLSSFDTTNVTNMMGIFLEMDSLTALNVSNFNTSKVTDMMGMFNYLPSLQSLDVSSFDTSNVTNMMGMFGGCSALTNLDLSSFDTSNVTDMSMMFVANSNLNSITYGSNFIRKSDSNITDMYTDCPANKPTDTSWDGATY